MFAEIILAARALTRATRAQLRSELPVVAPVDALPDAPSAFYVDRGDGPLMHGGWQPWDGTGQVSWDD